MDEDLCVMSRIDDYRSICVSTLSRLSIEAADAQHLGEGGYFIYEMDNRPYFGGVSVLAKAASLEAALRLGEIFAGSKAA